MNEVKNKTELKINLSTYYILPLLKLNKSSFGEDNFIKSQVTKYGEVVVYIKNGDVAGDYYNHENFGADVEDEDGVMIIYNVPDRHLEDYQMFIESKYSKMSMFAKDVIKAHATVNGLLWMKRTEEVIITNGKRKKVYYDESSRELMALDLSDSLRETLEEELDVKIAKGVELWNKLEEEEFIKL